MMTTGGTLEIREFILVQWNQSHITVIDETVVTRHWESDDSLPVTTNEQNITIQFCGRLAQGCLIVVCIKLFEHKFFDSTSLTVVYTTAKSSGLDYVQPHIRFTDNHAFFSMHVHPYRSRPLMPHLGHPKGFFLALLSLLRGSNIAYDHFYTNSLSFTRSGLWDLLVVLFYWWLKLNFDPKTHLRSFALSKLAFKAIAS